MRSAVGLITLSVLAILLLSLLTPTDARRRRSGGRLNKMMAELREACDEVEGIAGRRLGRRRVQKKAVALLTRLDGAMEKLEQQAEAGRVKGRRLKTLNELVADAGEKKKALVGKLESAGVKLPEGVAGEKLPPSAIEANKKPGAASANETKAENTERALVLYKPPVGTAQGVRWVEAEGGWI